MRLLKKLFGGAVRRRRSVVRRRRTRNSYRRTRRRSVGRSRRRVGRTRRRNGRRGVGRSRRRVLRGGYLSYSPLNEGFMDYSVYDGWNGAAMNALHPSSNSIRNQIDDSILQGQSQEDGGKGWLDRSVDGQSMSKERGYASATEAAEEAAEVAEAVEVAEAANEAAVAEAAAAEVAEAAEAAAN